MRRVLSLLAFLTTAVPGFGNVLFQIGAPDRSGHEFALAPDGYTRYAGDGFFAAGRSDPGKDWPYVHPGPQDSWAGSRSHTFAIVFSLQRVGTGEARLTLDLADTHYSAPPVLDINVNGTLFERRTRHGSGDDSIKGHPERGTPCRLTVDLPSGNLRTGDNVVTITTREGSWLLYDAVTLEAPEGTALGETGSVASILEARPAGVLVRQGNGEAQSVSISMAWSGEETDAVARIGGLTTPLRLKPGVMSFEAAAPAVDRQTSLLCTVSAGDRTLASRQITLEPVRKWTVYLLPHSHNDIGYTMPQDEVLRKQMGNIRQGIGIAEKTKDYPEGARFKWNAEVMWAFDALLREAKPDEREAIMAAVRRGQLGLDGLYGNFLTALLRPEEWFRSMEYASEAGRLTGVPVTSAMITDVPGCTWGMTTVLAQSGVRYFSISPNQSDRIGRTFEWGDKPFWWVSPSGRERVLVWMTGTPYSLYHPGPFARLGAGPILAQLRKLEAQGYPYDVTYFRYTIGGDNGPPDPDLSDAIRAWNEKHTSPRIVIATTREPFEDLERRYGDKLPVVKGDFTPYWEDGAGSAARETAANRRSADRLVQAETLFALRNPKGFDAEAFRKAWQWVLLFSEHTWGAWNSVSEPDSDFAKVQWATKRSYAEKGSEAAARLLEAALKPAGEAVPGYIDVFNTSSWPRTGLVTVPASLAGNAEGVVGAPSQRLTSGDLVFLARDVPAYGSKRYRLGDAGRASGGSARAGGATLMSSTVRVTVDSQTGGIRSLYTRRYGEMAGPKGLNTYTYLPGSDVSKAATNGSISVRVLDDGPLVATLEVTSDAPGCESLRRVYRVVEGLDSVEIIDTLNKKKVREKEGVHIGFDFAVPGGQVSMETPWAVVRPDSDQIAGACRNWFTVARWADVSNDRAGVTWCTPDTPLMEIGGLTANILGGAGNPSLWMDKTLSSQTLYSWALNNHWHTNYPADQEGLITQRYVLTPHGPFDAAAAYRAGVEAAEPLLVAPAAGPEQSPRLAVEGDGVVATSVRPGTGGTGVTVRLYGAGGKDAAATVSWDGERKTVTVPAWGTTVVALGDRLDKASVPTTR
jgi:hypothetical protein